MPEIITPHAYSHEADVIELPDRSQRGLLHSDEAETSVLGGLLLDNSAWLAVSRIVTASDFYYSNHRLIFEHIAALIAAGDPVDVLTVAEALERSGKLAEVGGQAYVGSLPLNTLSAANVRRHAEIVRERAQRRELAAIGNEIADKASSIGTDVETLRAEATTQLSSIRPVKRVANFLDWRELAKREPPARVWALAWWIAFRVPTLLVGAGGAGKTLLLLQIGACLALAHRFIDEIPQALRVLLWCCEDDHDELWRRMSTIARWLGVDLEAFADRFIIVPRLGMDNTLFTSEFGRPIFTAAFEDLRAQAADHGAQVILLDNSAQLYGGDENSRHDVTTFLNGLMGAHRERAVILAAHPSRQSGSEFSGSSAWENAVRTRLYLGRTLPDQQRNEDEDSDDAVRYLSRRKSNYSPRDWRRVTFKDGVLVPDEIEAGGGLMNSLRKQKAERVVIEAARRLQQMGTRMTDGSTSPQFLPKLIVEHKLSEGCTKRELADAMRQAMLDGKLTRGVVGKYQNRLPMHGLMVVN